MLETGTRQAISTTNTQPHQPIPIAEDQFLQITIGQLLAEESAANNANEQLEQQIQCWVLSAVFKCFKCLGFKCQQQPAFLQLPSNDARSEPKTSTELQLWGWLFRRKKILKLPFIFQINVLFCVCLLYLQD